MNADTLFFNAKIYTVDADNTMADAMVISEGKIVFVGKKEDALGQFNPKKQIDLKGKFVYPGFIDAHCHFVNYAMDISQLNVIGTKSWDEVIDSAKKYAASHHEGWILGRGWDQNDWSEKDLPKGTAGFPTNEKLNELFPDRPVFLKRVDGHACIVNQKALDIAHFDVNTKISGGELITLNGKLTGVLVDNATDSMQNFIPLPTESQLKEGLLKAQRNCLAVGLTTVDDAGIQSNVGVTKNVVELIDSMQKQGELKMRFYMMVYDDESKKYFLDHGPLKTERLDVRAFKYYADGALGSRGALLLKPYTDDIKSQGLQLHPATYFEEQAQLCLQHGFQMCTHAIGDSANRMMLNVYAKILGGPNNKRWRIEHCQVVAPDDFELFHRFNIVPSVQTTHATSDMSWAINKLGVFRIKGAYAYKDLLKENGWLANGSDFPVEDINPLYGFYAGVARRDQQGNPSDGFQPDNAITRDQALHAMTIWAAQANFEENEKGSLEPGKFADFVVMEKDIMTIPIQETFSVKVLSTYINGEKVFSR